MDDKMVRYSLAICCQEIRPKGVDFHFSAASASAKGKDAAISVGISLARVKWPEFVNYQCVAFEIDWHPILKRIVKKIGNEMKKPPATKTHPMVIPPRTRNTPEHIAFNDGLLTAEEIVFSVFAELQNEHKS